MRVNEVERVIGYLDDEKASAEWRLRPDIRSRVYEGHRLAEGIYKRHRGRIANAAREIRDDIPVIICSAYSEKMDPSRAGAFDGLYIEKPIEMQKLAAAVHRALVRCQACRRAPRNRCDSQFDVC